MEVVFFVVVFLHWLVCESFEIRIVLDCYIFSSESEVSFQSLCTPIQDLPLPSKLNLTQTISSHRCGTPMQ